MRSKSLLIALLLLVGVSMVALLAERNLLFVILNNKFTPHVNEIHLVTIYENSKSKDSPLFSFPSCLHEQPYAITVHVFINSNDTIKCLNDRFSFCQSVTFKFYDSGKLSVNSASNHYSAASANKKLKLLQFFQHKIQRFMYLDADTFLVHGFLGLIEAWKSFELFEKDQFIGMSKELSDWYKYESYNSGVILVDVQKSLKYPSWKEILEESIKEAGVTALADQDVYNLIDRKSEGKWFHRIDCGLNFQHAGWENCPTSCVRIMHFNAMGFIHHTTYLDGMLAHVKNITQSVGCDSQTIFPNDKLFDWIGYDANVATLNCK